VTDKEKYICLNCYNIDELSDTLRCKACDSDVVASCETVQNMTPKAESKLFKKSRPVSRQWYHLRYGIFETIVSYTKANSLEEAIRYASSSSCEWYPIQNQEGFNFVDGLESKLLNHAEYLQWCENKWPLISAVSVSEQST
jgi:hypothetical protein